MSLAEPRAAIVGGGVAGLGVACGLTAQGWSATVLERRPDLSEGGRAILLQPNGLAALDRLGALERVLEKGLRLSHVAFYGRGRRLAAYDYAELRHPHPYCVEIRPGDLRGALADRLADLGGEPPRLDCEVVGLPRKGDAVSGVRLRNAEGREEELDAACVVGADGPRSTVRSALGIGSRLFSARDAYVLGTLGVDTGAREVAVYCGAGYADGVVPLRDGTYFWDRVTDENRSAVEARDLMGWREVFARRLPPGTALVDAIDDWGQLTVVEVRPFWARARVAAGAVLAGDAAGAVHPHSAQGANLALEDAAALADTLEAHGTSAPVPVGLLERFSRPRRRKLRRYVIWSLMAAGSLDAPNRAWRVIRASGFAWNRVGPMRRQLLRRQAGLG
jgi:2-polyprenyl-6-methoxyphenol hydroxylase-like FAD-dependent oxidoreductase